MTPYPYFIEIDAHASTARSMLVQLKFRHLPVREDDTIVGVVTEHDLRQAEGFGVDISIGSDVRVRDVCRRGVYLVGPNEPLVDVLRHMAERYLDSALIIRNGRLAGIFTFSDACRHFAELLERQPKR